MYDGSGVKKIGTDGEKKCEHELLIFFYYSQQGCQNP